MKAEYKSTIPHLTILAKYAIKHAVAFSDVESNAIVEAMEEYAGEVTKDMYPKEFVEWIIIEFRAGRITYYDSDNTYSIWNIDIDIDYTLDELFEYWQINIKANDTWNFNQQ